MELAYWCVLMAGLMPYAVVPLMRGKVYDNRNPRDFALAQTDPARRRALAAHQNSFEVFPLFAVAVMVAAGLGMTSTLLNVLALSWVVLRGIYIWAYVNDREKLRSPVWALGMLVAVVIFTMPVWTPLIWQS